MTDVSIRSARDPSGPRDWLPPLAVPALAGLGFASMALQAASGDAGGWTALMADDPLTVLDGAGRSVAAPWLTLTLSGLATGMAVFLMAVGLTLAFGMMGAVPFGFGAFISLGACAAVAVLVRVGPSAASPGIAIGLTAIAVAAAAAMAIAAIAGYLVERVFAIPARSVSKTQILFTVGGLILVEQSVRNAWRAGEVSISIPHPIDGTAIFFGAMVERGGLIALALGVAGFVLLRLLLGATRFGLLVRAGIEDREMVAALGYRLPRIFALLLVLGATLAGLGGVVWALSGKLVIAGMGSEILVLVIIVALAGGLGSVEGCLIAALLVGLTQSYATTLAPDYAYFSGIGLLVVVLLWRAEGLLPKSRAQ